MSILDKHRHGCLGIVNTVVNIKFAEFFSYLLLMDIYKKS